MNYCLSKFAGHSRIRILLGNKSIYHGLLMALPVLPAAFALSLLAVMAYERERACQLKFVISSCQGQRPKAPGHVNRTQNVTFPLNRRGDGSWPVPLGESTVVLGE